MPSTSVKCAAAPCIAIGDGWEFVGPDNYGGGGGSAVRRKGVQGAAAFRPPALCRRHRGQFGRSPD